MKIGLSIWNLSCSFILLMVCQEVFYTCVYTDYCVDENLLSSISHHIKLMQASVEILEEKI